jgi:hypothetical protein
MNCFYAKAAKGIHAEGAEGIQTKKIHLRIGVAKDLICARYAGVVRSTEARSSGTNVVRNCKLDAQKNE